MLSVFCSPSRYTQGKNATASLGQEMAGLGLRGPALIVAGHSAQRLLAATWEQTFKKAEIVYAVHSFYGECSLAEIEQVRQAARQARAQVIVGAGGGKVLDTARAAAADLNLPVVTCPSVASSDAPCSALSVIYNEEGIVPGGTVLPDLAGRWCRSPECRAIPGGHPSPGAVGGGKHLAVRARLRVFGAGSGACLTGPWSVSLVHF